MIAVAAKRTPDLTSFYSAFAPLCFTLLGLWLIVVQTRHSEWRRSPVHRARAYALSINFAMPGMMALLALVDPGNQSLWRAAFAVVALGAGGVLAGLALRAPVRAVSRQIGWLTTGFVTLVYLVVAVVAIVPGVVGDLGVQLTALEVEELLLSVVVLIAVNVAWVLMFEEVQEP